MKFLYPLFLSFFIFQNSFAQDFTAYVTESDSARTPIYQANISIEENNKEILNTKTYFDGKFSFASNPLKTYLVKISYPGFKDTTVTVVIDKSGKSPLHKKKIALQKDGMRLMGKILDAESNDAIKDAGVIVKNIMTRKEDKLLTGLDGKYNLKLDYETNYMVKIDKLSPGIINQYHDTSFYVSTIGFNMPLDFVLDIKLGKARENLKPRAEYNPYKKPENKNLKPVIEVIGTRDTARLAAQNKEILALKKQLEKKDSLLAKIDKKIIENKTVVVASVVPVKNVDEKKKKEEAEKLLKTEADKKVIVDQTKQKELNSEQARIEAFAKQELQKIQAEKEKNQLALKNAELAKIALNQEKKLATEKLAKLKEEENKRQAALLATQKKLEEEKKLATLNKAAAEKAAQDLEKKLAQDKLNQQKETDEAQKQTALLAAQKQAEDANKLALLKKAEQDKIAAELEAKKTAERVALQKEESRKFAALQEVKKQEAEAKRIALQQKAENERLALEAEKKANLEKLAKLKEEEEKRLAALQFSKKQEDEAKRVPLIQKAAQERLALEAEKKANLEKLAALKAAEEKRLADLEIAKKQDEENKRQELIKKANEERLALEAEKKANLEKLATIKAAEEKRFADIETAKKQEEENKKIALQKKIEAEKQAKIKTENDRKLALIKQAEEEKQAQIVVKRLEEEKKQAAILEAENKKKLADLKQAEEDLLALQEKQRLEEEKQEKIRKEEEKKQIALLDIERIANEKIKASIAKAEAEKLTRENAEAEAKKITTLKQAELNKEKVAENELLANREKEIAERNELEKRIASLEKRERELIDAEKEKVISEEESKRNTYEETQKDLIAYYEAKAKESEQTNTILANEKKLSQQPTIAPKVTPTIPIVEEQKVKISGSVFSKTSNKELENVTVSIHKANSILSLETQTIKNGTFNTNVENGFVYFLSYLKNGFEIGKQTLDLTNNKLDAYKIGDFFLLEETNFEPNDSYSALLFSRNNSNINTFAYGNLFEIIKQLKQNVSAKIKLYGIASQDEDYPQELSTSRVREVGRFFTQNGIKIDRISINSYGTSKARVKCGTNAPCSEEEHKKNRAVMFEVEY